VRSVGDPVARRRPASLQLAFRVPGVVFRAWGLALRVSGVVLTSNPPSWLEGDAVRSVGHPVARRQLDAQLRSNSMLQDT
jgi:hypothetical protein